MDGRQSKGNRTVHVSPPLPCTQCESQLLVADKAQRLAQAERRTEDLLRIRPIVLATAAGSALGKFNPASIAALLLAEMLFGVKHLFP